MLTDLISSILMLYLNIHLDDSLSDRVDLNMDQNSSIITYNYLSIMTNSSASDFFKFC